MAGDPARILFIAGCVPFIVAGGGHAIATLVDVWKPTFFTPTVPELRGEMERSGVRLRTLVPGGNHATPSMWRAWLGFNLSHGVGAVVFGALLCALAVTDFGFVRSTGYLMPAAIGISACYVAMAMRFWFYAPLVATSLGTICFIAAYALA